MARELYHGGPSANSLKPLIELAEKHIEYVSHFIDFGKFGPHDSEFVEINPRAQVPVAVTARCVRLACARQDSAVNVARSRWDVDGSAIEPPIRTLAAHDGSVTSALPV